MPEPIVWPDRYTAPRDGELDQLGFSTERKCPVCGAGLYWSVGQTIVTDMFICLNGCHLSAELLAKFHAQMRTLAERVKVLEAGDGNA